MGGSFSCPYLTGGCEGLRLGRPRPAVLWGCGEALASAPPRCWALVRSRLQNAGVSGGAVVNAGVSYCGLLAKPASL